MMHRIRKGHDRVIVNDNLTLRALVDEGKVYVDNATRRPDGTAAVRLTNVDGPIHT